MLRTVIFPVFVAMALSPAEASSRLADANNIFGVDLLRTFAPNENHVFVSPFSITTAMAMVYHGTRGTSEKELFDVMGYKTAGFGGRDDVFLEVQKLLRGLSLQNRNATLEVANAVLISKHFSALATYKKDLQDAYHASFKEVDFLKETKRVVSEINEWVSVKTKGKINKVLDDISPETILFIMNAVYFKGNWKSKFLESKTRKLPFYNFGKTVTDVDTMSKTGNFRFARSDDLNADILELPYAGDDFSMLIILPRERDGLGNLSSAMTASKVREATSRLFRTSVNLRLPKFKLESEYSLVQQLKDLGAVSIFETNADLSGIHESGRLVVSDVIHKAVVEVNEEGSEAAAFTGVRIALSAAPVSPSKSVDFIVDHPFVFFIRRKEENLIFFAGVVNQL
ncbi:intracellular coagulation inhibitor 1-like [Ornithodoros turicata]|uniref:intracellular coagulation inhibitor 1-like n=1 Tax=Ornithodoros turicata TaxID=34597 RepID=UPI003139A9D1